MSRFLRRRFTLAAALSAVLCAATAAAWWRSRSRSDALVHVFSERSESVWSLASDRFAYQRQDHELVGPDPPGWYWRTEHRPAYLGSTLGPYPGDERVAGALG